jgi:hypothetical protein
MPAICSQRRVGARDKSGHRAGREITAIPVPAKNASLHGSAPDKYETAPRPIDVINDFRRYRRDRRPRRQWNRHAIAMPMLIGQRIHSTLGLRISGMDKLGDLISRQKCLGPVDGVLSAVADTLFDRAAPAGQKLRNFFHGTWFGHPLHPALTNVPLGTWTAATVLDLLN